MSRLNVFSDASGKVADSLQAAYFRALLADERTVVTEGLTQARVRLVSRLDAGELRGVSRARQDIRVREAELRDLDRFIGALDQRFAARWTASG